MPELGSRLREMALTHADSLDALRAFVDTMHRKIDEDTASTASLATRFSEELKSGADTITFQIRDRNVELTRSEFDMIVEAVNFSGEAQQHFPKILLEMAFIYRVALYDALLPDVLLAVLTENSDMLKSRKKTMTHQEILEMPDRASILEAMASKEIHDFGYSSTADQVRWLEDRFGITLLSEPADMEQLAELMARRNLLVHANGIVNASYLRQVASNSAIGERLSVDEEYWRRCDEVLTRVAEKLLREVTKRFLPGSEPPSVRMSRRSQRLIAEAMTRMGAHNTADTQNEAPGAQHEP